MRYFLLVGVLFCAVFVSAVQQYDLRWEQPQNEAALDSELYEPFQERPRFSPSPLKQQRQRSARSDGALPRFLERFRAANRDANEEDLEGEDQYPQEEVDLQNEQEEEEQELAPVASRPARYPRFAAPPAEPDVQNAAGNVKDVKQQQQQPAGAANAKESAKGDQKLSGAASAGTPSSASPASASAAASGAEAPSASVQKSSAGSGSRSQSASSSAPAPAPASASGAASGAASSASAAQSRGAAVSASASASPSTSTASPTPAAASSSAAGGAASSSSSSASSIASSASSVAAPSVSGSSGSLDFLDSGLPPLTLPSVAELNVAVANMQAQAAAAEQLAMIARQIKQQAELDAKQGAAFLNEGGDSSAATGGQAGGEAGAAGAPGTTGAAGNAPRGPMSGEEENYISSEPVVVDKFGMAIGLIKDEIGIRLKQINTEQNWVSGIRATLATYFQKMKRVNEDIDAIHSQIEDLKLKKAKLENLAFQFKVNVALGETKGDLRAVDDQLSTVNTDLSVLKKREASAKQLVTSLEQQLQVLRKNED